MKWLGQTGLFGAIGVKMSKEGVKIPKCAACQFGKQERTPKGGSTIKKSQEGILKRDKLRPGELVFLDQFESRLPGRVFNNRGGQVHSQRYKGGSLFCDAATGRVKVYFQSSFTAEETLQTKL